MKKSTLFLLFTISLFQVFFAQDIVSISGTVQNSADDKMLSNVHVINLNNIKGVVTDDKGVFNINAKVNDTLYFTYLGF